MDDSFPVDEDLDYEFSNWKCTCTLVSLAKRYRSNTDISSKFISIIILTCTFVYEGFTIPLKQTITNYNNRGLILNKEYQI